MTRRWCVAALALVITPLAAQAAATDVRPATDTALAERLRAHVEALAGPAFGGRGTGQPGFQRAAEYVRDRLQALGLEPLGDGGTYFQTVPWTRVDAKADACALVATMGAAQVSLVPGPDFAGRVWFDQSAQGELALWQCHDPERIEVDAAAVAGRVLLVELAGVDLDTRFGGLSGARSWASFESGLHDLGAAAVVIVDDARAQRMAALEGNESPGKASPAARASSRTPNELYMSRAGRDRLAALAGATEGGPPLRLLPVRVQLTIEVASTPAPACNVVARLPGSDPAKAAEQVLIGCHLDHLGVRNGIVYPGADDDASGTAAILELAAAFAKGNPRLRRSVVFAAFCGEEVGLIGSKYFVTHPPVPLPSIVAELQLDMIGRSEENERETAAQNSNSLHLIGSEKLSMDLHRVCLDENRAVGKFDLEWDEEEVFWRSDHVNFAKKGIPVAFFFTGFHSDYHLPGDTPDKLEYGKLARVVEYVQAIATHLAQQDDRPQVDRRLWEKNRERLLGPVLPAAPMRR